MSQTQPNELGWATTNVQLKPMKICGVWVRSSTGDFSILRIWDVRTFDGHLAIFGHIRSKSTFPLNKHHLFRYHVFEILVQKSPPKISDSRSWMSASSRVMQEENGTLNKTHPARLVVAPMGGSGRLWIIGPKTDPLIPSWKSTKALSGRWRCCLIFTISHLRPSSALPGIILLTLRNQRPSACKM
jgi:hypothetical protein